MYYGIKPRGDDAWIAVATVRGRATFAAEAAAAAAGANDQRAKKRELEDAAAAALVHSPIQSTTSNTGRC